MRVLAIDTSSEVLGVAVLDEEGQYVEFNFNSGLRHASHLVPMIKILLKFSGMGLGDIDGYAVSIGPGSFTGLRIGVATIKALVLVNNKKVVAVPSLDVLAHNISQTDDTICVIVDAKKEKLYSSFYRYKKGGLTRISPYHLVGYDELFKRFAKIKNDILLIGDGIEKVYAIRNTLYAKRLKTAGEEFWYPKAFNAARIGLEMLRRGCIVKDVDSLVPVYMHPKDVQCRMAQ